MIKNGCDIRGKCVRNTSENLREPKDMRQEVVSQFAADVDDDDGHHVDGNES
jgi:hypothetical protein